MGWLKKIFIGFFLLVVLSAVLIAANIDKITIPDCPNLIGVEEYTASATSGRNYILQDTGNRLFDGWKLKGTYIQMGDIFTPCEHGNQEGENVNYSYCRDIAAEKIDTNGNINKTKTVTVVLSLSFNQTIGKTVNKTYISTLC